MTSACTKHGDRNFIPNCWSWGVGTTRINLPGWRIMQTGCLHESVQPHTWRAGQSVARQQPGPVPTGHVSDGLCELEQRASLWIATLNTNATRGPPGRKKEREEEDVNLKQSEYNVKLNAKPNNISNGPSFLKHFDCACAVFNRFWPGQPSESNATVQENRPGVDHRLCQVGHVRRVNEKWLTSTLVYDRITQAEVYYKDKAKGLGFFVSRSKRHKMADS